MLNRSLLKACLLFSCLKHTQAPMKRKQVLAPGSSHPHRQHHIIDPLNTLTKTKPTIGHPSRRFRKLDNIHGKGSQAGLPRKHSPWTYVSFSRRRVHHSMQFSFSAQIALRGFMDQAGAHYQGLKSYLCKWTLFIGRRRAYRQCQEMVETKRLECGYMTWMQNAY
ncbi:hypothetical protein P154DRAFT_134628 [Amniculicola lignicola CBS 123094]|uniref:Uncharacterized protein n=1 Tax=Amniculicola lignicola CBS 123094 TaxID=1392246 RepID=A0A6A5WUD3_9PLEO|nr:hypothetical protein P154DRAFT_134628 [Amniculicola lignicola CBS 123094]